MFANLCAALKAVRVKDLMGLPWVQVFLFYFIFCFERKRNVRAWAQARNARAMCVLKGRGMCVLKARAMCVLGPCLRPDILIFYFILF
jgi:hypothetical protein